MADPEASPTATLLLSPSDGPPPCLSVVHILPPVSSTTTPTPLPVLVPSLSPTTDPCGDSILQPAIFSPTAASVPGIAQPVSRCSGGETEGAVGVTSTSSSRNVKSLLEELSLSSDEALLAFVYQGLKSALVDSVQDSLQPGQGMEDAENQIALMAERWTAGMLSSAVKSRLNSLVTALKDRKMREAQQLQEDLKTSHSSEVSEWIAAVERIVHELHSKDSRSQVGNHKGQGQRTEACVAAQNNGPSGSSLSEGPTESLEAVPQSLKGKNTDSLVGGR